MYWRNLWALKRFKIYTENVVNNIRTYPSTHSNPCIVLVIEKSEINYGTRYGTVPYQWFQKNESLFHQLIPSIGTVPYDQVLLKVYNKVWFLNKKTYKYTSSRVVMKINNWIINLVSNSSYQSTYLWQVIKKNYFIVSMYTISMLCRNINKIIVK